MKADSLTDVFFSAFQMHFILMSEKMDKSVSSEVYYSGRKERERRLSSHRLDIAKKEPGKALKLRCKKVWEQIQQTIETFISGSQLRSYFPTRH